MDNNLINLTEEKKAKILSIIVMAILLFTIYFMLDLALITFIIVFVFYHLQAKIETGLGKVLPFKVPGIILQSIIYIVFLGLVVFLVSELIPRFTIWVSDFINQVFTFDVATFMASLGTLNPRLVDAIDGIDFGSILTDIGAGLSGTVASFSASVGGLAINFMIALILSFTIIAEKEKVAEFGRRLEKSKAAYVYNYFIKFGGNFCKTFGTVMKVQVSIATINCLLSAVALKLIGFHSILPLSIMIFVLGLIPVAGVIISLFPLCIMAFNIGGIIKIIEVLAMIALLHAVEAYILNPKLMSHKTRLPVCFTFMILLVGEHYLGVWGLLIGVPLFIFMMVMLDVDYQVKEEKHGKKEKKKAQGAE